MATITYAAGVKFMYREINDLLKTTPQVDGTEN